MLRAVDRRRTDTALRPRPATGVGTMAEARRLLEQWPFTAATHGFFPRQWNGAVHDDIVPVELQSFTIE